MPRPLDQREALAGRADGAAVVRRRDGRSVQAVPSGERLPPPACPPLRPPSSRQRRCRTRMRGWGGSRLRFTGPPPKFYGTRDILQSGPPPKFHETRVIIRLPPRSCRHGRASPTSPPPPLGAGVRRGGAALR